MHSGTIASMWNGIDPRWGNTIPMYAIEASDDQTMLAECAIELQSV